MSRSRVPAGGLLLLTAALAGCRQEMYDQPKYEPLEASAFFPDQRSARHLVEGTVPRGSLRDDTRFYTGKERGQLVTAFPAPAARGVLERGRERYDIFCAPCHDRVGEGRGMVVQRGYRPPLSFHIERLREAPVGHFFDVITNGFGAMPDHAAQIPPEDRWAIVAYVRALQLSQGAKLADVPREIEKRLIAGETVREPGSSSPLTPSLGRSLREARPSASAGIEARRGAAPPTPRAPPRREREKPEGH